MKRFSGSALCFLVLFTAVQGQSIRASKPTHYFYTPAAYVNPPFHLVLSFHEISFSLPANLQLQASILDNIGRVNFGAKFGILQNFSLGGGLAYNLVHIGNGVHGITHPDKPRFGFFLTYGFVQTEKFEFAATPHTQIGERFSIGGDLGMMLTPHEFWSVILEFGLLVDTKDGGLVYMNTDGGLRIHPPKIPFLSFDAGIDLEKFAVNNNPSPTVTVFFDVIFAMIVR